MPWRWDDSHWPADKDSRREGIQKCRWPRLLETRRPKEHLLPLVRDLASAMSGASEFVLAF